MNDVDVDVVVVGAGIAGLYAGLQLKLAGLNVLLLEARDRVGGRTCTEAWNVPGVGKVSVDIGGQWVGPPQKLVMDLVKRYGIAVEEQYSAGTNVIEVQGKVIHSSGSTSELKNFAPGELDRMWRTLDGLAATVDVAAPWTSPDAAVLDSLSFKDWVQKNCRDPTTAWLVEWFAAVCLAAETKDVSMLYFLAWLKSGGYYQAIVDVANGAQNFRLVGGMQQLAEKIRDEIGRDRVLVSSPVSLIEQSASGVCRVHFGQQAKVVSCQRVVVAMSPYVANKIRFSPTLPAPRRNLADQMRMGRVIKCMIAFRRPFWRDAGFSGQIISDQGPMSVVYDRSDPVAGLWALVGFFAGDAADAWGAVSEAKRQEQALAQLGRIFGNPKQVLELFSAYVDHDWSTEEYSGGCFFSYFPPGVLTSAAGPALRTPCGRIHWAGTETSDLWIGYIDGALSAGDQVAKEVLLKGPAPKSKL